MFLFLSFENFFFFCCDGRPALRRRAQGGPGRSPCRQPGRGHLQNPCSAAHRPSWVDRERKRTRKALQAQGLMLGGNATTTTTTTTIGPSFRPTKGLQVSQWTKKAVVHDFGAGRGKGLVATTDDDDDTSPSPAISSGEVIWKEDPWAIAPEWRARVHSLHQHTLTHQPPHRRDIFDLQWSTPSRACAHCTTPFAQGTAAATTLVVSCPALSSSSRSTSSHCPARFCHRLCLARAQATHHPLLCPVQNPGGARLVRWARHCEWLALHALARVVSRVLLSYQRGAKPQETDEMDVVRGWAALGMEERVKCGA